MSDNYEAMLTLTADNRGVIKAFKEVSDQVNKTGKETEESTDEASAGMNRLRDHTLMLRDAMSSLIGMVGIGGVAFGLKDLAEEGEKLQTSQARLQQALKDTGQDAGGMADKLQQFSDNLSQHGGFASQAENMTALTRFITETHSATKAQQMLTEATNVARDTGDDLSTSVAAVARAYDGQARGLLKLIGPFASAKDHAVALSLAHQKDIVQIQELASLLSGPAKTAYEGQAELAAHLTAKQEEQAEVQDKVLTGQQALALVGKVTAGQAAAFANTVAGRQADVAHTFENLTETIGLDLMPEMKVLLTIGAAVADMFEKEHTVVEALAFGVGGLAAAWGTMRILKGIKTMAVELGQALKLTGVEGEEGGLLASLGADEAATAWRAFMVTTIAGLVIVGLVEMIEHWKQVEAVATAVWHGIESAAVSVWHAIVAAAKWGFNEIKSLMRDLGFTGNGVMSYLNPLGLGRHIIGGIGSLFNQGGVVPEYRAAGGSVTPTSVMPEYRAYGGPMLPMGTDTIPAMLSPGEGVVSAQGMDFLNAINTGQMPTGRMGDGFTINADGRLILRTTDRDLGEATLRWIISRAARGPSSLIGGSLVASGVGPTLTAASAR